MENLATYAEWHRLQVETSDLDPVYPVLRELAGAWSLDEEETAWMCVAYLAFYHLGSGLVLLGYAPHPSDLARALANDEDWALLRLPCATERRGHRDTRKLRAHLLGLREHLSGGVLDYLLEGREGGEDWERVVLRAEALPGNGRWASYKLAELLQKVVGVPIKAPDAGHRYSSGPRKGLARLFPFVAELGNGPDDIAALDELTSTLGWLVGEDDVAQVETSLCDFNSLVKGGYYLGHDIDAMLDQISDPRVSWSPEVKLVKAARAVSLPDEMLGELHYWAGVRPELKTLYARTGELDWRNRS